MNKEFTIQQRDEIIAQIKKYAPLFRRLFENDKTVSEYSKDIRDFTVSKEILERQKTVQKIIIERFQAIFGKSAKKELNIHFSGSLCFNIVDHHQFLNHPLLIGDNVIANVDLFLKNKKQNAIVVVSSGDVPPNNVFSKNGFQLHGKRVPLFSNSEREWSTNLIPKRNFDFVERLKKIKRWSEFSHDEQIFLEAEQERIQHCDFSRCTSYKDQVSIVVKETWSQMFEEKLRKNLPELLYITQEDLSSQLLLEVLQHDNFVSHAILDKSFRKVIIEKFRGIVITWNEKNHTGTHFFWRKHPKEPRFLRMYLQGEKLVPNDKRYEDLAVPLDKETVLDLLQKGEIYPSLFTIFSLLFYFGVKPQAGQGSIVYLNLMKDTWIDALHGSEFEDEVKNIESIRIDTLIAGVALFYKKEAENFKTQYAYDIIFDGGVTKEQLQKIFNLKYRDLLSTSVVGIYDYIGSKYVPKKELIKPTITSDDLAKLVF